MELRGLRARGHVRLSHGFDRTGLSRERRRRRLARAAERERERLLAQLQAQNETLRRQAEALRELATPIVPTAGDVIALPLVGDIDPERADQILQGLLDGVATRRARVAIIDITGVRSLDTFGAEALPRPTMHVRGGP